MNNLEKEFIDRGILTEEELNKSIFSFSDLYAGIMNSMGKFFISFCILLILIIISATSGSVLFSLYSISIFSIISLVKYRRNFLPGIVTTISLMTLVAYYIQNPLMIGTIGLVIYILISIVFKNKEMLAILPLTIYSYIVLLLSDLVNMEFKSIILTIGVINFLAMVLLLTFEDKIRKSKFGEKYIIFLLETIALSMGIIVYYQFEIVTTLFKLDGVWWVKNTNSLIINLLYIGANLFIVFKSKVFTKDIKVINTLILISTIKVPFLAFCLFLYNLALVKRWYKIKQMAFYLMLMALWLIYYTLEVTLLVKSIGVAIAGILMIVAYIILNKRGVIIEE